MSETSRPLAIITGASSGIGLELAKLALDEGYDLIIAADEPEIHEAAVALGTGVRAVQADLATLEGVDQLYNAARELGPVDIHLEFMTAAARWMMALKLWSVLSARMAMRLNSLSLQKKFSIR